MPSSEWNALMNSDIWLAQPQLPPLAFEECSGERYIIPDSSSRWTLAICCCRMNPLHRSHSHASHKGGDGNSGFGILASHSLEHPRCRRSRWLLPVLNKRRAAGELISYPISHPFVRFELHIRCLGDGTRVTFQQVESI